MSFHFIKKIRVRSNREVGDYFLNSKVGSFSSILIDSLRYDNPLIVEKNLFQHCCCPSTNKPFLRRFIEDLLLQVIKGIIRQIRGNICHIERGAEERKLWSCKIGLDLDDCDLDDGDGDGDDFDAKRDAEKKFLE